MDRRAELSLAAVLRQLHAEHASVELEVFCGTTRGRILLEQGQVVAAGLGRAEGRIAVRAMVAFRAARYVAAGGAAGPELTLLAALPPRTDASEDELDDAELDALCAAPAAWAPQPTPTGSRVSRATPSTPPPERVAPTRAPAERRLVGLSVLVLAAAAGALAMAHFHGALRLDGSATPSAPAVSAAEPSADLADQTRPLEPRPRALPIAFDRPIRWKGSDTIGQALGPAWAKAFAALHPGAEVKVEALGSSAAFGGLLDGTADLGASSRRVRPEEQQRARALGVSLHEVRVAYDAVAVIVHPDGPLDAADLPTLGQLFAGELGALPGVRGELTVGHLYGRPSYSGTHAFFVERVFGKAAHRQLTEHFVPLESTAQIAAHVAAERDALGVVSLGRLAGNVQVLPLAEAPTSSAPVAPTADTVRTGSYPLARPLYLYLRGDAPITARAFVDFVLGEAGQAVVRAQGFVDLGEAADAPRSAELTNALPSTPDLGVERIYFGRGAALLDDAGRATLRTLAPMLAASPTVLVLGNSDGKAGAEGGSELALRRAERVADVLLAHGVPRSAVRIDAENYPLASNDSRMGRAQNRRVDVLFTRR
jgi:phosphate transport system substrate-binding protein